jgi:uncharacterized membrane protein
VSRLWEIDATRTLAIAMMVAYHAAWDVWWLAPSVDIDPFGGGWRALQVACGSTFLLVVGVSFAVSTQRLEARGVTGTWARWRHHARRAVQVLGAAALVSAVTLVALGTDEWIRFGILHCIGVTMLLLPLLRPLGALGNAALGVAVILVGRLAVQGAESDVPLALVLGWTPPDGAGVDHYPLLPWAGVAMLGVAAGLLLYPGGARGPALRALLDGRTPRHARLLTWPGRHALPIYLLHQGVVIALVAAGLALAGIELDPGQR